MNQNLKVLLLMLCVAFSVIAAAKYEPENKDSAKVQQVEGYYTFILSKPVKEYTTVGTVEVGLTLSGKPEQNFKSILKRVKKEYPKADGIIFHDMSLEKVDVIQFK